MTRQRLRPDATLMYKNGGDSPLDEPAAFRKRHAADYERRAFLRRTHSGQNRGERILPGNTEDDVDLSLLDASEGWTNAEGETLGDFGVDE